MRLDCDTGKPFVIVGIRRNDDVDILRSPDDAPRIDREATDEDELDTRLGESAKELVKGGLGQSRRAAPTNRMSR